MAVDEDSLAGNSSDEDLEWEEVHVPEQQPSQEEPLELEISPPVPRSNIEITLHTRAKKDDSKKQASAALHAQRVLRTTSHKIHTVCLLANARERNKWLNDDLLHARLLSMTPLPLQNGFAIIHKSTVPDPNKRGRLFEAAVTRLVEWWSGTFYEVVPTGHIRSRTFDEVQDELLQFPDPSDFESDDNDPERIRSVNSLMKHALMRSGSRDVSAQLFTSLCRALDIPARLVVSLQSVPWQSQVGKQAVKKDNIKGKGKAVHDDANRLSEESEMEEVRIPSPDLKGKGKEWAGGATEKVKATITLRKKKDLTSGHRGSPASGSKPLKYPDPVTTPPVFWTEVFSRADSRWLPVDAIRGIVNKRHVFDPAASLSAGPSKPAKRENRMLYVVGLEEDGYGRDITARYARDYTAKVSKVQGVGAGPSGGRKEWWARVVRIITRPYRLQRDDLEDDELHNHQLTEGMPTTIAGFKDHPLYALARHLKREEVIDPPTELGKFRGDPVYPRSSVISLKTAENWMRQGRVVREGCQPMKMVKQRAMTVGRQREMELALDRAKSEGQPGGEGEILQGLYARSQTDLYKPEPIKDGKIPKNDFGNIDLYVPSMLPEGAVHIPFKGVAKIAKKLGLDYAEAVTGFEFKKRRAYPVLEGIVVAAENENVIVEAYLETEHDAEEKARAKRLDRVCKRWVRLIQGLRLRDRLQKQYALNAEHPQHWLDTQVADVEGEEEPGGFLTTADDVVEPFHLPRDPHTYPSSSALTLDPSSHTSVSDREGAATSGTPSRDLPHSRSESTEVDAGGDFTPAVINGAPKTMQELAEDHWRDVAAPHESFPPSSSPQPSEITVNMKAKRVQQDSATNRSQVPTPGSKRSSRKRTRRSSESSSDHHAEAAPPKRGRGPVTNTPSGTPARVLRPRAQKSAARIQEEQEMEEAYRRAIAD
ncbi:hypothetical protein F5I97DRAFT_2033703 [Phlebopus sp. FC_14]|nr:hypothetical protein F5I97DRAFT_2033703 [Phlebopus sp. FC_14]